MRADPRSTHTWAPPSLSPFADAPSAGALKQSARATLAAQVDTDASAIATAFAHGSIAVQADHTHYSDGFALMLSIPPGVAVAVTRADAAPRLLSVRDNGHQEFAAADVEAGSAPEWAVETHALLRALDAEPFHVAVASTVPGVCRDSYWAALAASLVQALDALDAGTPSAVERASDVRDEVVPAVTRAVARVTGRPYSVAYPIAALAAQPPMFLLLDTATRESLPVETEAHTALGWALLDPGTAPPRPAAFHRARHRTAEAALDALREGGFDALSAFRDLEHRDLERAHATVRDAQKPIVRHLVTENRRVQKHVASMRQGDWQMIGALLLMSHNSRRTHWDSTSAPIDFVVEAVESLTIDGLYGACMTERDGAVLVTGRPPSFAEDLRRLNDAFEDAFDRPLRMLRV